ncbi:MAG: arsenate reductase [Gemmatimonas sp.]|nr:arsenate reductase [Gemmatimonas sp.]
MDVQIFGTKRCRETQKAQRFFKERRVKIHMVDLDQRPASAGELQRFVQKFGAGSLLDREGKRFRDRGLHVAHISESRILPLLEEDPKLIRTPLVRSGKRLSIGYQPEAWAAMLEGAEQ